MPAASCWPPPLTWCTTVRPGCPPVWYPAHSSCPADARPCCFATRRPHSMQRCTFRGRPTGRAWRPSVGSTANSLLDSPSHATPPRRPAVRRGPDGGRRAAGRLVHQVGAGEAGGVRGHQLWLAAGLLGWGAGRPRGGRHCSCAGGRRCTMLPMRPDCPPAALPACAGGCLLLGLLVSLPMHTLLRWVLCHSAHPGWPPQFRFA